jgi:hypothetical protein
VGNCLFEPSERSLRSGQHKDRMKLITTRGKRCKLHSADRRYQIETTHHLHLFAQSIQKQSSCAVILVLTDRHTEQRISLFAYTLIISMSFALSMLYPRKRGRLLSSCSGRFSHRVLKPPIWPSLFTTRDGARCKAWQTSCTFIHSVHPLWLTHLTMGAGNAINETSDVMRISSSDLHKQVSNQNYFDCWKNPLRLASGFFAIKSSSCSNTLDTP